jgi:hypothetical protein
MVLVSGRGEFKVRVGQRRREIAAQKVAARLHRDCMCHWFEGAFHPPTRAPLSGSPRCGVRARGRPQCGPCDLGPRAFRLLLVLKTESEPVVEAGWRGLDGGASSRTGVFGGRRQFGNWPANHSSAISNTVFSRRSSLIRHRYFANGGLPCGHH